MLGYINCFIRWFDSRLHYVYTVEIYLRTKLSQKYQADQKNKDVFYTEKALDEFHFANLFTIFLRN